MLSHTQNSSSYLLDVCRTVYFSSFLRKLEGLSRSTRQHIEIELKLTFESELVTGIHFIYYLSREIFSFILVKAKNSREMSFSYTFSFNPKILINPVLVTFRESIRVIPKIT